MRLRVYFNRLSDLPRIWSFDHGTQETEQAVSSWKLYDVDASAGYDFDVSPSDKDHPRVWIELSNVMGFNVLDDVLYVYGKD
jgi:hypothetical protein